MRIDQVKFCEVCGATLRQKGGRDKIRAARDSANGSCPENEHHWSETQGIVELKESPFWRQDFEAFLSAKRLWEWENDYLLRQIGYLN